MSGLILIPKYRELVVPLRMRTGVRGFFKIEARGADGRMRTLADWFPNLQTTLGADLLGSANPLGTCVVGAGNAAPALGNTALQSLVAATTTINPGFPDRTAQSSPPYFGTTAIQYAFAMGVATGNLSEVGVGNSSISLFSRALILDGGGSPTTITVLSSEALYVTYVMNQYVPAADVTGTIVIGGITYNYVVRASQATATQWAYNPGDRGGITGAGVFNGAIGAITSSPSGSGSFAGTIVNDSYSNGSHELSGTTTFGLLQGNLAGGISAAQFTFGTIASSRGVYQVSFAAVGTGNKIPKDGTNVLTLSASSSWAINSP